MVTPARSTRKGYGAAVVSVLALAALFGGLIADGIHQIKMERFGGFRAVYEAAECVRTGRNPYARVAGRYSYVYPPLYACLMRPALWMEMDRAARVMLLVDAAFIAVAIILIATEMSRRLLGRAQFPQILVASAAVALMLAVPIHSEIKGLETNALVLLCFAAAFFWSESLPWIAGAALALAINVKYLPLTLIPFLVLRRRWAIALWTLACSIALALAPAIVIGWETNLRYLSTATRGLANLAGGVPGNAASVPVLTHASSVSITSGLARMAQGHGVGTVTIRLAAVLVAIGAGALALVTYRQNGFPFWKWPAASAQEQRPYRQLYAAEWCGVLALVLALGPNTQDRLLILAAFPAILCVTLLLFGRGTPRAPLVLGAIFLLLAVTLPVSPMGRAMSATWKDWGMPGWLVLGATMVIFASAIAAIRAMNATPIPQFDEKAHNSASRASV